MAEFVETVTDRVIVLVDWRACVQKVQVDFVARTAEDCDSHGIRNLLQQVGCDKIYF